MTSTTKWETKRKLTTIFVKSGYKVSNSRYPKLAKRIIDWKLKQQSNELVSKINKVLKQGHGGGNWRRLIIQLQGEV